VATPTTAPDPTPPAAPVAAPPETPRPEAKAPRGDAPTTPGSSTEPARIAPTTPPPEATPPAPVEPVAEAPAPKETISVVAPGPGTVGGTLVFQAKVASGWTPTLYYRAKGATAYQNKTMVGGGGDWKASLKVDESMAGGVDWFVQARSADGKIDRRGSAGSPMKVAIQ
jgi:hypothetical protein